MSPKLEMLIESIRTFWNLIRRPHRPHPTQLGGDAFSVHSEVRVHFLPHDFEPKRTSIFAIHLIFQREKIERNIEIFCLTKSFRELLQL